MGVVAKIISALAAILPIVAEWWAKRRAAQEQAATADRVADIRRDPGDAWVRKFGGQQPGAGSNGTAGEAGSDQPGGNAGGRNHDG